MFVECREGWSGETGFSDFRVYLVNTEDKAEGTEIGEDPQELGLKLLRCGSGLIQAWTRCLPVGPSHLSSSKGEKWPAGAMRAVSDLV